MTGSSLEEAWIRIRIKLSESELLRGGASVNCSDGIKDIRVGRIDDEAIGECMYPYKITVHGMAV